jgi:uncharacterized membrane protein
MELGMIALGPAGGIGMFARAAFGVAILCLAIPIVCSMWRMRRTERTEPDDLVDLDALWERYRKGEISWDEYLRGKIEGARGLAGTKADLPGNPTPHDEGS